MSFIMLKKLFLSIIFSTLGMSVFSNEAFATIDISLVDDPEKKELTVIVNSNDEYLDGIDLNIIFSDDIEIDDTKIFQSETFCTFSKKFSTSADTISIECLNDSGTIVNGILATIPYTTESEDYSFYIDRTNLDLGLQTLGEIKDINKPEEILIEEQNEEQTLFYNTIIDFFVNNFFYLLGSIILIIALIILAITLIPKKKDKQI